MTDYRRISCRRTLWMAIPLFGIGLAVSLLGQPLRSGLNPLSEMTDQDVIAQGKELAEYYCGLCHRYTPPELLDKKTWVGQTLPRMKIQMGMAPEYLDLHAEADLIKAIGRIPAEPVMTEAEFKSIIRFYSATAPKQALPQEPTAPIRSTLPLFQVDRRSYRRGIPAVTLLRYDASLNRVIVGHDNLNLIEILSGDLARIASIEVGNTPTGFTQLNEYAYVTAIGSFMPSDRPKGELILYSESNRSFSRQRSLLKDLRRPTETVLADFNSDGKQDFVITSFGHNEGGMSWYENQGKGRLVEHKLFSQPGALRPQVGDFNRDGYPDIAVLVAQNWEIFFIFTNDGQGGFTGDVAFQRHALFGHSSFEMVDFNQDGLMDILATNGDNGEYPSPLKRYHGVRVYLNQGENRFEEAYFFPMNGAFQALGRDFDQDGDVDIAAISFFPDYTKAAKESFVYLENLGGLAYSPASFPQRAAGRWLKMDAGDIDQDGDLDLLLGSYIQGPTDVPDGLMRLWQAKGPSMLVLRNQLNPKR